MIRCNITDGDDRVDKIKYDWLKQNLPNEVYCIRDTGFFISDYVVEFKDEKYATLYLLRFSK
ncbi:MAG: hypothetical protein ABFD07_16625 [Methanobacterium sp.]